MFFETFINTILNRKIESDIIFRDFRFRKFVIETKGKNLDTIKFLSEPLSLSMKRPQRCLHNDPDYYLGLDTYSKTYYICYKTLLMIDIDLGKDGLYERLEDYLEFLEDYCSKDKDLLLELYKTRNGVHCFVINQHHDYKNDRSIQLMLDLKCDFYYVVYSYIRAWSVRLNRKFHDRDDKLYTYLKRIGTGTAVPYLEKLVKLHMGFSDLFKDREISLMK